MTSTRRDEGAGLPLPARRLVGLTAAAALLLATIATLRYPHVAAWSAVLVVAAVFVGVDLFRIDLPYRRGGLAMFSLTDAVLTGALLLTDPSTVVLGVVIGVLVTSLRERQSPVKLTFNVSQYVAAASAAVLVFTALNPPGAGFGPATVVPLVASAAVFLFVNTATVAGIIALTSGSDFGPTFRRMTGPAVLLGAGNVCMGLLAVLLLHSSPWALPALAVPLGLLHAASAQAVRARLASERSQAFVDIEQRLGEAQDPQEIRTLLGDAVGSIFGCQGAVWHDDRWVGEVPPGSGPCPVNPDLATPLRTRGPALGPAVDGEVSAVGLGDAVLVAWPGELGLDREAGEWLERLAASGRVHTARSRAAAGLRQERATLRAVVDGTVDGILVLDPNGTVELCNPAMASLAQLDGPAAIGRAASDVLREGPWEQSGVHDVVRGTGDNRRVWRVSVSPVHDRERGELRVAVVHDVSAERRVARMKDDMLSIVSHELRTPLTPIKGSAQLLRRRWERMTDTMRVDLLTSIEQRADHLARLVDDLLLVGQLSASDDARLRVQTGPADLAQLARDAVTQLTHAHPRHELALDAPAELPLVTDQLRVRQIVDNLVNNACKYSEPGSRVDVDVTTRDGYGVVRVTDHGRGIPAEDLGRVFERFERVEDPLNMQTGGAGLGLYIVKALSTALGGNVVLESVLGAGTTVTLTLPLDAAQSSATSTGSRRESSDESSDDDRDGSSSSSRVSSIVGSSSS